ncbi:hypothetical protein ABXT11_20140 [Flavobacterium hydatis]
MFFRCSERLPTPSTVIL